MMRAMMLGTALLAAGPAMAMQSIQFRSERVEPMTTDFVTVMGLQRFDPSLGVLRAVSLTLNGDLSGSIAVENRARSASVITAKLAAELRLTRPAGPTLVVTLPEVTRVFHAAANDGRLDFGGASGKTWDNIFVSGTATANFADAADLAFFTGTGLIDAPLIGTSLSAATGSGNLVTEFVTMAGGYAEILYSYDLLPPAPPAPAPGPVSAVPEATTWAMMITGFGMVGWALRRRRRLGLA